MARPGVTVSQDHMRDLLDGVERLTSRQLLVGIPEDRSQRQPNDAHGAGAHI